MNEEQLILWVTPKRLDVIATNLYHSMLYHRALVLKGHQSIDRLVALHDAALAICDQGRPGRQDVIISTLTSISPEEFARLTAEVGTELQGRSGS